MQGKLDYAIENDLAQFHGALIAGVDEAGRGPWAGPVIAAAVMLDPNRVPAGITDSKVLSANKRNGLYDQIMDVGQIGVGIATVARIDRDNILQATLWAMTSAVNRLKPQPDFVLVDGNQLPDLNVPAQALVRGDACCLSIAAASIIAKVTRDRIMIEMSVSHPGYGFERHKGYGTREHQTALNSLGVCQHHRRSFRPVQLRLGLV